MARPTVLVVDTNESRRKELGRGLAEFAYEVATAESAASGMRFATGLNPTVIVATTDLEGFGDGSVLKFIQREEGEKETILVLLSEQAESPEAAEGEELPGNVIQLDVTGLTAAAVLRKVRTLLVGMELGLETDARLESLIGDLQLTPLFDMLPLLQRTVVTGRLLIGEAEIAMQEGAVTAARVGNVRGLKAFVRIARIADGTFRLLLGPTAVEREIHKDMLSLMAVAMEDQQLFDELAEQLPDLDSKIHFELGPAFFATQFTPAQQEVLKAAQAGPTIRGLLEATTVPDGEAIDQVLRLKQLGFIKFEEPEVRVRVITDSTCDLPAEVARRHRIQVVPLSVIFGEDIYRDGVDLTPGAFYRLLASRKDVHPRTSPPSKGEFLVALRDIVGKSDVVGIHISGKMSQTVVNARAAVEEGAEELRHLRAGGEVVTEVVDAAQTSTGLGLLVLLAARMTERGLSAKEIKERVEAMRPRIHLLFVVDTLEYLARGGRIGKARALLGGLLGIKPILGLVEGEVVPIDRVRGGKAAQPRLIELLKQRVDASKPVIAGIGHAAAPVWSDRLRSLLQESFQILELVQSEIGPVVGTHVGPGCVGAVMFQPTEEEIPLVAPLPEAG